MARALQGVYDFLAGGRFPAVAIALLLAYELVLALLLVLPIPPEALGGFAEQFKTWCFGFDPATGRMEPMYVGMMLGEPVGLSAILLGIWWTPLRQLGAGLVLRHALVGLALCGVGAAAFGLLRPARAQEELPFPAERLRTSLRPPAIKLVDQDGKVTSLAELRGRVVLLTGIYSRCGFTCPMILREAKRAVAALAPADRKDVTVLAITLDPAHDTPSALAQMAQAQGVSSPEFRLLSGDVPEVNAVLDRLGVERRVDPTTGVIDHPNLFILVDRDGRAAYRFTVGERQREWLHSALELLLHEARPGV
jgi:protein SCO1/2